MSKVNIESTIFTALRVASEVYDQRAKDLQALPLARDGFEQSAKEARALLDQLEDGALRIVERTHAVTDTQRQTMMVAALREAGAVYSDHAGDKKIAPRIRAQFERQAAEARVVSSRFNRGELHIIQGLSTVQSARS